MSDSDRDLRHLLRTLVAQARDDDVTFLAAAIAYYAFVSLVPLLLLVLSLASLVDGAALAERIVGVTGDLLTPEAEALVKDAIAADGVRGSATLVGVAVLTWSGLRVFRALDRAFAMVYDTAEEATLLGVLRDAVIALGAIGVGVTAVTLAVGYLGRFTGVLGVAGLPVVLVLTLWVAFFPMYYRFPGDDVTVQEALPGTGFAALGWTLLGEAFHLYAAVAATSLYGVLGAALLLITWLYLGALILLLGAVVNATLAGRFEPPATEDRQLQQ